LAPSETPVAGQRLPERALRFGRIAAEQFGKAARGRPLVTRDVAFRQKRAQQLGLRPIKHATARRTLAPLSQRHRDTVQRADILLGRRHPVEDVS